MIGIYKYQNKINQKIYIGQSIDLEQRKYAHKSSASNNKRKFSEAKVKQMRSDYDNGLSPKEVWLKYAPDVSWSTVYNIITRHTYKDIK